MSHLRTRRDVFRLTAGGIAGGILAASASPATAAPRLPRRKSIDALPDEELRTYEHALKIVIDRGLARPSATDGYVWQAALHNNFERERPDGSVGACEHRNELFFPWHRAHLAGFERILRESDPPRTANIAIPYWDWTKPVSGVRFPRAFEDRNSPLFHSGRYHQVGQSSPAIQWDAAAIKEYVQEKEWSYFAGEALGQGGHGGSFGWVEDKPHNAIHPSIGPTMGDPESAARDPIYWSFHAYIDLVWARWQKVHTSGSAPQPFTTPNAIMWVEPFTPVVADTAQTHQLPTNYAYDYEYDFSIDASPPPDEGLRRIGVPMTLRGGLASRSESLRLPSRNRKLLRLRDVVVLPDVSYSVRVYVYPEPTDFAALNEAQKGQYLADTAWVWKSRHGHARPSLLFDITDAVARLQGANLRISVETRSTPVPRNPTNFMAERVQQDNRLRNGGPLFGAVEVEER